MAQAHWPPEFRAAACGPTCAPPRLHKALGFIVKHELAGRVHISGDCKRKSALLRLSPAPAGAAAPMSISKPVQSTGCMQTAPVHSQSRHSGPAILTPVCAALKPQHADSHPDVCRPQALARWPRGRPAPEKSRAERSSPVSQGCPTRHGTAARTACTAGVENRC